MTKPIRIRVECEEGTVEANVNPSTYYYIVAALQSDALLEELDDAFREAAYRCVLGGDGFVAALPDNTEGNE